MASSSGSALSELEAFLQRPPPNWTPNHASNHNNPMAIAHAALEFLRESGDEQFLFLRTILELATRQQQTTGATVSKLTPHEEELLFHCITGCRMVALWQYKTKYSSLWLQTLRDFMMILGFEPTAAPAHHPPRIVTSRTVQMACFSTSVALWKRGWNAHQEAIEQGNKGVSTSTNDRASTPQEESLIQAMAHISTTCVGSNAAISQILLNPLQGPNDLFHCMQALMSTQSPRAMEGGALYLQSMVTEFVGKSSISYRLPLEYHKEAHRSFERQSGSLTKALQCALGALEKVLTHLASNNDQASFQEAAGVAPAVVQLTLDCLGWEFGMGAWAVGKLGELGAITAARYTLRPPVQWKEVLHPIPIVEALVHVIRKLQEMHPDDSDNPLTQCLRQLLLTMATLTGPIFQNAQERKQYASMLLHGTLQLLQKVKLEEENSYLIDVLQILGRLVANFRLSVLAELNDLNPVLSGMAQIGQQLLHDQVKDCEQAGGDVESMELREWREEALSVLVADCTVLLASDPWLMYSGSEVTRRQAQKHLASLILGPLYSGMVASRTRMAALEEHYIVSHEAELDEAKEEILATDQQEELEGISTVGRLDLATALASLAERHSHTMPRLQALWGEGNGQNDITAETAALLEEARLLTLYVSHLLTDDNKGEAPEIPLAVMQACQEDYDLRKQQPDQTTQSITNGIASAVQALMQFAEAQMQKIAADPTNRRLSPILAKTFLQFLQRWGPSYIYPIGYSDSTSENPIVHEWAHPDKAQQAINFCITLCLSYQCHWPQEKSVQEESAKLLLSLVKRGGKVRAAVVHSPMFLELVKFHCVTANMRHGAPPQEFDVAVRSKLGDAISEATWAMVRGYQRLPYDDRAQIFSVILIACSDPSHGPSTHLFNDALKAVHDALGSLFHALGQNVRHDDVNATEMTSLCLAMIFGLTESSEMNQPERIPQFMTPFLAQLASLMSHYSNDLTVCEKLLQIFQNYTSQFIIILTKEQSVALFQSSAELLKSYSKAHCQNRVIKKATAQAEAEEEQAYNDILCAIQLLINLGAKDFIDACKTSGDDGVDSSQVTDMIFFGLQQILPLMTQGLLQFPTLCSQFFELVGFMMDTYPDKVCRLPFDLLNPLLQALLFGMSHHDMNVAKASLHGLASIAREHLKSQALQHLLTQQAPDLLDQCLHRLFTEVIFKSIIMDRVESCGYALLPLAAANLQRLNVVMTHLCETTYQKDDRLKQALSTLLTPEKLSKASLAGYEGRMNRALFKEAFSDFVSHSQSFLVLR